jgi:lysozyme family protein
MNFETVARGYANLWAQAKVKPEWRDRIEKAIDRFMRDRARYDLIEKLTTVPWWWVACVHERESGGNFKTHLHNGDPLSARTVGEPANRPARGEPPFTWEQSAVDALQLKGVDKIPVGGWSIPRALWEWERYNGLGYFGKGNSPYIWSGTNLYVRGKYVADHQYDETAVDKQIGVASVLKVLVEKGIVTFGAPTPTTGGNSVSDLKAFIGPLGGLIPNVVTVLAGPLAGFAVKAIAEAIPGDVPDDVAVVTTKLKEQPFSKVLEILQIVNTMLAPLAQQTPTTNQPAVVEPTPVVVVNQPTPAPVITTSPIDKVLGGETLKGYKTLIMTGLGLLVWILSSLHLFPTVLTPEVVNMLLGITGAGAWLGFVAKQDRGAPAKAG